MCVCVCVCVCACVCVCVRVCVLCMHSRCKADLQKETAKNGQMKKALDTITARLKRKVRHTHTHTWQAQGTGLVYSDYPRLAVFNT